MSTDLIIAIGWIATSLLTGALGIVLGPWVRYRIFRSHARSVEQRAMVESWLEMERRKCSYALASVVRIRQGVDPATAAAEALAALVKEGSEAHGHVWPFDPERVQSRQVRRLTETLNKETKRLLLSTAELARTGKLDGFEQQLSSTVDRCEQLRSQIVAAMAKAGL